MEKTLQYIIIFFVCGFFAWLRISSLIKVRETNRDIKNLTQDFLNQKKSTMSQEDYKKWLRKINTIIQARILENKSRGLKKTCRS